jgi:hypothetical protein
MTAALTEPLALTGTLIAVMVSACAAPVPRQHDSTVTESSANTAPVLETAPAEIPVARASVEVGDTRFYDLDALSVTVDEGERLVAVRHRKDKGLLELTAMAPGEARVVVHRADGPLHIVIDIPESPHNRCNEVKRVPVNGLVEVEHARMYRHAASPAGNLHITSVGPAVSFDGPGTLLLMTSDHNGVHRCTRFEADEPVTCQASVTVIVGTTIEIALPNTSPIFLHDKHVSKRWENNNETLLLEGTTPGVTTLWIRHDATGWQCTAVHVVPKPE